MSIPTLVRVYKPRPSCYILGMMKNKVYISQNTFELKADENGLLPQVVQLLPFGHIKGRDGREFYMNNTTAVIANTLSRFSPSKQETALDLVIDYEHQTEMSEHNGNPAPAAAWIKQLINRDKQGIWGVVEWTAQAAEYVKNRQYRFLSPVFTHDKKGNIIALLHAGLTNTPNLELKAFNSQQLTKEIINVLKTQLCELLGLDENTSDEDIIAAVRKLVSDTTESEAALNKMKATTVSVAEYAALNKEIAELKKALSEDKALTAVNKAVAEGKLPPALKDKGLDMYQTLGAEYFNEFISGLPIIAVNKTLADKQTIQKSSPQLEPEELSVCKQLGLSVDQYQKNNKQEEK